MSFKDDILASHNEFRKKHGALPLTWSNELANGAAKWAQNLANINRLEHDSSSNFGENIAMAGGKELTGSGATQMWYDEIKDYNFNQPAKYNPKCGHFTQVVWAASTELGAGIAKSKSGNTYVVARYNPAGNMMSKFEENVLPPGSRVPKDTKPSNKGPSNMTVTTNNNIDIENGKQSKQSKRTNSTQGGSSNGQLPIGLIFQIILIIVSFGILLAAIVSDSWSKFTSNGVDVNVGLWETLDASNAIKTTRSFCILADVALVVAFALLIMKARAPTKVDFKFPAFALALAVIFGVIGASVYTAQKDSGSFGWSYTVAWTATGFASIAFIFVIIIK